MVCRWGVGGSSETERARCVGEGGGRWEFWDIRMHVVQGRERVGVLEQNGEGVQGE
jgi:hypothetical protein